MKWRNDLKCPRCGRRARGRYGVLVCTAATCLLVLTGCAGFIQAEWCLEQNDEGECYGEVSEEAK